MMKYIGTYDTPDNNIENRYYPLAATNKMNYILSVLKKFDSVEIVSISGTLGKKSVPSKSVKIEDKCSLKLFYSIGDRGKIFRILNYIIIRIQFFFFLLFHISKNENVVVYHSLAYMNIVSVIHKIKKFNLILEVEEIYSDVIDDSRKKKKEIKYIESANAYIFPTALLNKYNINNKPYSVIHGIYHIEKKRSRIFNDDLIHIVYAGTFDPRKGGLIAASTAKYLSDKYHIHILGFGNKEEVIKMKQHINELSKICNCKISYDGMLDGDDYIQFIQSCDIGLSPQDPNAKFNATSFPSKILSYMSNGLRVVSIRIPAIENSTIGSKMYFYDEQTPNEIANTIMNINFNDGYDAKKLLKELDMKFCIQLKDLLDRRDK